MVYQNFRKLVKSNADNVDAHPLQQKIAMLTDIIENDESKCAIYFPPNVGKSLCFMSNDERRQKDCQQSQSQLDAYFTENDYKWLDMIEPNEIHTEVIDDHSSQFPQFNFNFFCVKTVDCISKGGYTIRKFHCLYYSRERQPNRNDDEIIGIDVTDNPNFQSTDKTFERKMHLFIVYHYWFPHWPDHRSPENIDVVLDMCINLIDSDCEQEFLNAHNDLDSDTAAMIIDETDEDSLHQTKFNEIYSKKCPSIPMLLNRVPFNGAIPIIHWLVIFFGFINNSNELILYYSCKI